MAIDETIAQLDALFRERRLKWYARLRRSGPEVVEYIQQSLGPVPLPVAVQRLCAWKDGEEREIGIKPGYFFLGSSLLLGMYEDNLKGEETGALPPIFRRLIPLFHTATKLQVCVVALDDTNDASEVIAVDIDSRQFLVLSRSLDSFLRTIYEGWARGAYHEGADVGSTPFVYTPEEAEIIREVDGLEFLPRRRLGVTAFEFDRPEQWPRAWRQFAAPPIVH